MGRAVGAPSPASPQRRARAPRRRRQLTGCGDVFLLLVLPLLLLCCAYDDIFRAHGGNGVSILSRLPHLLPRGVSAHGFYRNRLPNGDRLVTAPAGLAAVGHRARGGDGALNWFGFDFAGEGYRWTERLCLLDSDSDGQSNGLELGDPGCEWVEGQADPPTGSGRHFATDDLSHPGDSNSTTARSWPVSLDASRVVAHVPTVPHSGYTSLSYVLIPLSIAGAFGLLLNSVPCFKQSSLGTRLLQRRLGVVPLLATPKSHLASGSHPTTAQRRDVELQRLSASASGSGGGNSNSVRASNSPRAASSSGCRARCRAACASEFAARSWSLDLLLGEALFLAAVVIGLAALVINKQWNGKYRAANTIGQLASTLCFLVILPASRSAVWVWVFGIPFERAVKWHRLFGKLFVVSTYLHILVIVWRYGAPVIVSTIQWGPSVDAPYPYWGLVAGIGTTLIAVTAIEAVRRNSFELFYYVHVPMVQVVAVGAIFHAPGPEYRYPVVIAMGFYALDLLGRFTWRSRAVAHVEVVDPDCAGCVKLSIMLRDAGGVHTRPGDYVFLRFPQLSVLQSHPFSISTVGPGKAQLNFVIKDMGPGTFTESLRLLCKQQAAGAGGKEGGGGGGGEEGGGNGALRVGVEGPYGYLGVQLADYRTLWICAGGIGAAPMINVLMHVHARSASASLTSRAGHGMVDSEAGQGGCGAVAAEKDASGAEKVNGEDDEGGDDTSGAAGVCPSFPLLRHVHFCWVVRRKEDLQWYADEMDAVRRSRAGDIVFHLHLYVTGSRGRGGGGGGGAGVAEDDSTTLLGSTDAANMADFDVAANEEEVDIALVEQPSEGDGGTNSIFGKGRPDYSRLFGRLRQQSRGGRGRTALLVCGPAGMVSAAQRAAQARGWDVHKETFEF